MKKKVWMGLAGVLVIAALALILRSLFTGTDPEIKTADSSSIEGTYVVTGIADTYTPGEKMVFKDGTVNYYRGGSDTPYFSGAYEMADFGKLTIADLDKTFVPSAVGDHEIKLFDTGKSESWNLLRTPENGFVSVSEESLSGAYNVLVHSDNEVEGETITFENGTFSFKNADGSKNMESSCEWTSGSTIKLADLNMEADVYGIDDKTAALVLRDTGAVWVIAKE